MKIQKVYYSFLRIPLAYLGNMADEVQTDILRNSLETFYETFGP